MALSTHVSEWGQNSMKPNKHDVNISKEKFVLVNENRVLHDKELITKPVGYLRDAFNRFSKNKGAIFGATIVGILVLYAIIAPIFSPYTVSYNDAFYRFTLPKLFTNIDFIDGCAKKTLNEETLIYYYSMGEESGHNAIKRQEYVKNDKGMYTFRLDSYKSAGTIFLSSIQEEDYLKIQAYQDKTNRQVIFPITERSKRPIQAQDKTNANFWYKTEVVNSKTAAVDYTIQEDGKIVYTNIYLPYSLPEISTKKYEKFTPTAYVRAAGTEDNKFIFNLVSKNEGGQYIDSNRYISINRSNDDRDYFTFDDEIENAAKFRIDGTYSTPVINLIGHEDAAKDGDYYLALPEAQGSTLSLRKFSLIDEAGFLPLKIVDKDTGTAVPNPTGNSVYCLSVIKDRSKIAKSFISGLMRVFGDSTNGFSVTGASSSSCHIKFTGAGEGYTISFFSPNSPRIKMILAITVNPDDTYVLGTSGVSSPASIWHFDEETGGVFTEINNHHDASKNGNYYLASLLPDDPLKIPTVNNENYKVTIATKEQIAENKHLDYYRVVNTVNNQRVDEINTVDSYKLLANKLFEDLNYFLVTGDLKGDNYSSNLRIEGEDTYLYSYAYNLGNRSYEIRVNYYEYYRYYHTEVLKDGISEPFFLFGTTSYGQDIFTCLASGARLSFVIAIVVASVNMIVGAIYGAIEGYYGGKIDLVMERIVEILSAVPFMIVITLLRYHMKGTSQLLILFIAFFLTGWIGMSGLVRMQFYRFKNQEYVLASRTLGANDLRIMFKHIFPNSLGTIVTSTVLVIPGMIFSETSLSYLGIINLSTGSLTSVGTLLAAAQPYLVNYPHMILFPSIFISLLMLCFNLFGNGLRDAFNPSLRGTED